MIHQSPDFLQAYELLPQSENIDGLDRTSSFPLPSMTAQLDAPIGVQTIQATHRVFGKYSKWLLFLGLALASYIYSLDGQTTWLYLDFAVSEIEAHAQLSSVKTAQSIIIAVGKPVVAKIADTSSRGTAYFIVLLFYVVGYTIIASAHTIGAIGGGIVVYAVGYTGLQLLTQVIIADITTLEWRGLVSSLTSLPFIINAFVGPMVSAGVMEHTTWRWGFGMFAILVPASLSPLIVTLWWAEFKAKRAGLVPKKAEERRSSLVGHVFRRGRKLVSHLDLVGLLLIGASTALILLPITLANSASRGWKTPSMIAMLVVGGLLLPVAAVWEAKFARHPVIPNRFAKNRTVAIAALIGFFDFVSFYLTFTYLYSFILVVKPWSLVNAGYFIQTQSVALTVFGIMAGGLLRITHRYKYLLVGGLCIRLLGVGLMIHSRGADASDVEVVWTQIIQGFGGGIAAVASQVAAQASVPHADVAMATAAVLLLTEIGGAVGNAISGAVWTNTMPTKLAEHLPQLSQADRDALYESITTVLTHERGDPIREGVISAYGDVMHIMLVIATTLSAVPIILSLFMPNWYLGKTQNAVDHEDLAGSQITSSSIDDDGDNSSKKSNDDPL